MMLVMAQNSFSSYIYATPYNFDSIPKINPKKSMKIGSVRSVRPRPRIRQWYFTSYVCG